MAKQKNLYTFQVTARSAEEANILYTTPDTYGLHVTIESKHEYEDFIEYELNIENETENDFKGLIHCQAMTYASNPKFFMPAFLYNRNRGNTEAYQLQDGTIAQFPRLSLTEKGLPYSDYWMVCSNRLSHPISALYDNGQILAISANPLNSAGQFNGFSCQIGLEKSAVGFTLGYENAPGVYIADGDEAYNIIRELEKTAIVIAGKSTYSTSFRVYAFQAENELGINRVIRHAYEQYHQPVRQASNYQETIQDISNAIFEDAYVESLPNYSTRVFLKNGKIVHDPIGSIAWTGGVEVAVPELYAAARLSNEAMREQACTVIRHIVEHSLNENSGLPFDAYNESSWYTEGWWDFDLRESGHSSYLVGQALYYILLGYEIEKNFFKTEHSDWLEFVNQVLARIELTKDNLGEVPHIWSSKDGHGLDYDSFCGCWCVAASAYYCKLTGNIDRLNSAIKSAHHYYNTYISKMECYGTPHDTLKAVDSEGSLAFIKACRTLHEITGESQYLRMLQDGIEYEFTFKFCWNPPIMYEPLKRLDWSCCGGSVTSTCNPHIHPMSNNVMDELLYCYQQTKDNYYLERLKDTAQWAMQTYSQYDGQYDYGKKGWMSERFCYSDGLMIETYSDGSLCSTWKCFLPWGASNILEGFCGNCWNIKEQLEIK